MAIKLCYSFFCPIIFCQTERRGVTLSGAEVKTVCVQGHTLPYFILIMLVCWFCETNPKVTHGIYLLIYWHIDTLWRKYFRAKHRSKQFYISLVVFIMFLFRNSFTFFIKLTFVICQFIWNNSFNRPTDGESSEARLHPRIENNPQLQLLPTRCQCHPKMKSLGETGDWQLHFLLFFKFVLFIISRIAAFHVMAKNKNKTKKSKN